MACSPGYKPALRRGGPAHRRSRSRSAGRLWAEQAPGEMENAECRMKIADRHSARRVVVHSSPAAGVSSGQRKGRQLHDLPAFHGRFVSAEADAGPVGGLTGIWERIAAFAKR